METWLPLSTNSSSESTQQTQTVISYIHSSPKGPNPSRHNNIISTEPDSTRTQTTVRSRSEELADTTVPLVPSSASEELYTAIETPDSIDTAIDKKKNGSILSMEYRNYQRVALLLPLSGEATNIGQALLNSAQMALFEISSPDLVLQVYDTQGTPDGAVRAVRLALNQGVKLIIGPLFSHEVRAVSARAQDLNVNVLALTSDPTVAANGVFIIGHQLQQQVERIALFACNHGLTVFAALAPDDAYGRQAVTALHTAINTTNCRITAVEFYDPDTTDFVPAVKRLAQKKPFDAVLVPDKSARVKEVASLLSYFDIDSQKTKLLGTQLWTDRDLLRHEPAMIGSWYAIPSNPAQRQFAIRYQKTFGLDPLSISSLGYDAMALAAVLARSVLPSFNSTLLTKDISFTGIDGLFHFQPSGVLERGLAIMEIGSGSTIVVVSPAPEAFD